MNGLLLFVDVIVNFTVVMLILDGIPHFIIFAIATPLFSYNVIPVEFLNLTE